MIGKRPKAPKAPAYTEHTSTRTDTQRHVTQMLTDTEHTQSHDTEDDSELSLSGPDSTFQNPLPNKRRKHKSKKKGRGYLRNRENFEEHENSDYMNALVKAAEEIPDNSALTESPKVKRVSNTRPSKMGR